MYLNQVLKYSRHQVQVSTSTFQILERQVQVSTSTGKFKYKYKYSSTSTLLDPTLATTPLTRPAATIQVTIYLWQATTKRPLSDHDYEDNLTKIPSNVVCMYITYHNVVAKQSNRKYKNHLAIVVAHKRRIRKQLHSKNIIWCPLKTITLTFKAHKCFNINDIQAFWYFI